MADSIERTRFCAKPVLRVRPSTTARPACRGAGGGRRMRRAAVVKKKRLAADAPIPCIPETRRYRGEEDRQPCRDNDRGSSCNSSDEFRAFAVLESKGKDTSRSPPLPRTPGDGAQRLRLPQPVPTLLERPTPTPSSIRRAASGHCLTDDHKRQDEVFKQLKRRPETNNE